MDAIRKIFHLKRNVTTSSSNSNKIELNDDESMRLWMSLPYEIRQDVSLASFQVPNQQYNNQNHLTIQRSDDIGLDDTLGTSIGYSDITGAEDVTINDIPDSNAQKVSPIKYNLKISSLLFGWLFLTTILSQTDEKLLPEKNLVVPQNEVKYFNIPESPIGNQLLIKLQGSFDTTRSNRSANDLIVTLTQMNETVGTWKLPLISANNADISQSTTRLKLFTITSSSSNSKHSIQLSMRTSLPDEFPFKLSYDVSPPNYNRGIIYAASILIILYILIIFEIVHRTFAAMLASCSGIAVLALLNDRPRMSEIFEWIDIESLLLLFSMMILVAVLAETGVFDVIAVFAFKTTRGKIWPLIYCLCIVSALISSLLDNVTTILLMVPLVIRLCQVMHLNPKPILIAVVLYTNIGGTMTPVGGPPNIMITSNTIVAQKGISFLSFTSHMSIGAIFLMLQTALQLRFQYSNNNSMKLNESRECQNLRQQINIWKMALENIKALSMAGNLVANTLRSKIKYMTRKLKKMERSGTATKEAYEMTLQELKEQSKIKNVPLLFKSGFVFLFVIALFMFESVPQFRTLSMGWSALIGVLLLLIIYDRNDFDTIINRIEWSTLLFFAGMFVTMECLARLGLVNWIGKQAELIILIVDKKWQLTVAIAIILWVSAITSSFVDAIPVTAMMLKVVIMLTQNPELGLPIQPLLWALAYGPSIGGNGTLYGASANTVCACVAGRYGHKIGFIEYAKVCYPIMIGNMFVLTGYLMVAHVLFQWHSN